MPIDIDEIINGAGSKVIIGDHNQLISIDDLLLPELMICRRCPIWNSCPAQKASEKVGHCLIEEGLIIETTKDLAMEYGISIKDKLVLFSFMINLLNLHRLSRLGSRINFVMHDKDNFDIMNKYMAMLAKIDGRYHKSLQELQATKKEQFRLKQVVSQDGQTFMQIMTEMAQKSKKKLREQITDGNGSDTDTH